MSLRYGRWKYKRCLLDPDQLFDLEVGPQERLNLANLPVHQGTVASLKAQSKAHLDLSGFDAVVRQSQAGRLVVYEAVRRGGYYP